MEFEISIEIYFDVLVQDEYFVVVNLLIDAVHDQLNYSIDLTNNKNEK
jgi:hypothetical protein